MDLLNGTPVAELSGNEFLPIQGKTFADQVEEFFKNQGGIAHSSFGDVLLDRKSVQNSKSHGMSREKASAFAAVKDVLENGIEILPLDYHNIHDKKHLTGMIAAPISINNENYICVVIVIGNLQVRRLYVHEAFITKNLPEFVASNSVHGSESTTSPQSQGEITKILKNYINTNYFSKNKVNTNISIDKDGNYVSANEDGVDYVSETIENKQYKTNRIMKQTIRLTESTLRGMISEAVNEAVAYRTKRINEGKRNNAVKLTESQLRNFINAAVNEALNEIGDTERGQYALGAVQARSDMRARNAIKTGDRDEYQRYSNISGNANKTSFKHNYIGDMDDNYDSRKDLYNANQRGYKNYASYMNGAGNADYRTAPQTRKDVGY